MLSVVIDLVDGKLVLELVEQIMWIICKIGFFLVMGGDLVLMFFFEMVVCDMVVLIGGSLFYICNCLKDVLFWGGEVQQDGVVCVVVFMLFQQDQNCVWMLGFEMLELWFMLDDLKQLICWMVVCIGFLVGN